MARVKRGVHAAKKRRTTLERAAGYRGQRSRLFSKAKEQVTHSLVYAFNDSPISSCASPCSSICDFIIFL